MADEKKDRLYALVPGPDGKPIAVPTTREEESDPIPAEDGRYYLRESFKAVDLALKLAAEKVTVYCATCRAPLKVSRSFVFCTKDEKHFSVTMHYRP